jgi:hypothetical protein
LARLVVVTHEFDQFVWRDDARVGRRVSPYLLFGMLKHLERLGHSWIVPQGTKPVRGDVAILHVDATVVGEEYLALQSSYAGTINFGTTDISKRNVSRQLLAPRDDWGGPVIVKSNLNSGGQMEEFHNGRARLLGLAEPHPGVRARSDYRILDGIDEVEVEIWSDPALVVERFLPERDGEDRFAYRTWVFMGTSERCNRFVTGSPISKGAGVLDFAPVDVPDKLREERARLGFDFGGFDFVIHDGEPVLLDANRTPGLAAALEPMIRADQPRMAEGLDRLIRDRC